MKIVSPPDDAGDHTGLQASSPWPKAILINQRQAETLAKILEIDSTSKVMHGGLSGLIGLTDAQVDDLRGLVETLKKS